MITKARVGSSKVNYEVLGSSKVRAIWKWHVCYGIGENNYIWTFTFQDEKCALDHAN